jgi:outer membrane protein insertion porin family/translocation and assembly module TamA
VLGIREGELYREGELEAVKRGLFLTEAFRFVDVAIDTASQFDDQDSLVTINVTLAESQLQATRGSIGWGNLDCIRAGVNHTNYNFLGALRRLDLAGRISKVGFAEPFDFADRNLCTTDLREDRFSDTLNYYVSATISQAALFGARIVPSLSVYSERRSEFKAYLRNTPFGLIGSAQLGLGSRLPQTVSYQLEYGRTIAEPAFFCAVFNVCEEEARQRLERGTRSAVVGWSATRSSVASLTSPTSGSVLRVDLRHASPVVGSNSDASFNRGTIDYTWYRPALSGALVARLRAGAVLGSRLDLTGSPRFIPLQERLYAGGPNSVRGYRQNELGPAIYLPLGVDTIPIAGNDTLVFLEANPERVGERTVPTGGDNVVVGNVELRVRSFAFPELMQMAFFVDAGQVWNRGRAGTGVNFGQIRFTPGMGLRIFSPVGPIRVDIGYNPYQRPAGPAYVTPSLEASGALICVSPGNTLRVRKAEPGIPARQVDEGDCPASYAPRRGESFWNRLTFQFSIGQPF